MALRNPRAVFGVHQFSPYNRTTGEFYGTVKCLSGSSMSVSGEQVKLEAGSNKFAWAQESGKVTAELSVKLKEYPNFVFELFFGKAATETTTASAGEIVNFANVKGTSILTVITGVTVGTASNLKFGKYVIKATAARAVSIYAASDIDFGKGVAGEYSDNLLKIAEIAALTTGANVVAAYGLSFTATAANLTVGDTAEFTVLPAYSEKIEVTLGGIGDVTPEFGAIVMAEKRGDGTVVAIDAFRLKAALGFPISFEESAYSESEIKIDCLYDSAKNGVFKFLSIKES